MNSTQSLKLCAHLRIQWFWFLHLAGPTTAQLIPFSVPVDFFFFFSMKKERGDLTIDRVFELDKEQQKYLKMLVDDSMTIKDLVIGGKYHIPYKRHHNLLLIRNRS